MKEQPDLASVRQSGKWQGREVLPGSGCGKDGRLGRDQRETEQCFCPLLLAHLQEEGLFVITSGAIPQHSRGISGHPGIGSSFSRF